MPGVGLLRNNLEYIMPRQALTAAFHHYNAQLKNVRWASSAIAKDGSVVVSCWDHFMSPAEDGYQYDDLLSRWPIGHPGRNLLADHLRRAMSGNLPVRLVLAKLDEPKDWKSGAASPLPKTFATRDDLIGKVVKFDGNAFSIRFVCPDVYRERTIQQALEADALECWLT